jgi:hypothetical protein
MTNPLLTHLTASGPHPDLGPNAELYGQFVGSWDVDNRHFEEDRGVWVETRREVHFGWILGGRAIQDPGVDRPRTGSAPRSAATTAVSTPGGSAGTARGSAPTAPSSDVARAT